MVVQKKKKVKPPQNPLVFLWTGQRKKAALLLSEGTKTIDDIWQEVGVHERTLFEWRQHPIFQAEVSRLTLANEKATREGLLRLAYKAIEEKIGNLSEDRNTVLDWAEFISGLQGMKTQKHEVNANFKLELEGARELLQSTIAGITTRLRTEELLGETERQTSDNPEV